MISPQRTPSSLSISRTWFQSCPAPSPRTRARMTETVAAKKGIQNMVFSRAAYAATCVGAMVCVMGPAEATAGQTLQNHVPKAVGESRRLGPLSGMSRLNLAIGLPLRNRPELDLFLEQVSDPRSPNYRRYLSASEFAERFGPTQGDYDKLIEFFQANGLAVSGTHPNRMILDVTGPVSAIDKTLHVNMTVWEHQTRGRFFAPDRDPSLDADRAVLDISGLDNFVLPRPMNVKAVPLAAARSEEHTSELQSPC